MWSLGHKVLSSEESIKNAKSHCAGLSPSLSLYLSATACIEGTCGAAISSGRFMDVETMPVLRWVQLKTDASPANSMCLRVALRYCYREREKVRHMMGTNASFATSELICWAPCCFRSEKRDTIPDPKGVKACWGAEISESRVGGRDDSWMEGRRLSGKRRGWQRVSGWGWEMEGRQKAGK